MHIYPQLVTKLTNLCSGWIFGGSVDEDNPRDYDIFIPVEYWSVACGIIPNDSKINSNGGFKCISEGKEIDIWTGNMNDMLTTNYFKKAYHPLSGIKIIRENSINKFY